MREYILAFAFICLNCVCCKESDTKKESKKGYAKINGLQWLLGEWKNETKEGMAVESWKQLNDSTLFGRNYFILHGDTESSETVSLVQRSDDLYYIPTVNGQNNNLAVEFKSSGSNMEDLIFENPEHDFPQKIAYRKVSQDSILASITGMANGKEEKIFFPYVRISK